MDCTKQFYYVKQIGHGLNSPIQAHQKSSTEPTLLPLPIRPDGLLHQVVSQDVVGGHDIGGVPPFISIPLRDLHENQDIALRKSFYAETAETES